MHTKRYRKLDLTLCEEAVDKCFQRKWKRRDVLSFVEKYAGILRSDIALEALDNSTALRREAVTSCALALYETLTEIIEGEDPETIDPVAVRPRPDGMTGKIRDIALLCIMHQLVGHAAALMLMPLFDARIEPYQHASLPGRGQTQLKNQAHRYLLKEGLDIRYIRKIDGNHAYNSILYETALRFIQKELPRAYELHAIIAYLGRIAPGGHLIIGGYLDAWLFNFVISYALRDVRARGVTRRGKTVPYIRRCEDFMDDVALLSSSIKGIKAASAAFDRFCRTELGMSTKITTGIIKLLPAGEEVRRRSGPRGKASRGCPCLDMAGFKICRTHIAIRPRVFIRTRRQLLRGYRDLVATGTLRRVRAAKIIAYNGYVEQSDSSYLKEKYHVTELMEVAERVSGFYSWLENKKDKEALYDLQKRRGRNRSGESDDRTAPGRRPPGTPDGQRRGDRALGGRDFVDVVYV